MAEFVQQRHQQPAPLSQPRDLVVACPPLRSNVNLARIARAAGCFGVTRMVVTGNARIDPKIARDAAESITFERRRSLPAVLKRFREDGFRIVGLEQTSDSSCLFDYHFQRKTLLVIGNERQGIDEATLRLLQDVVEIPSYGLPYSHNVATATALCMYEYCRQFPTG
ncbi:MAG: RNA methyltransferase [bacterium]|nr:RNA methyltransferase [bacterium]